jgi:hypothetical protein
MLPSLCKYIPVIQQIAITTIRNTPSFIAVNTVAQLARFGD